MTVAIVFLAGGVGFVVAGLVLTARPEILRKIGYDRDAARRMSWWPDRLKFMEFPITALILLVGVLWIVLTAVAIRYALHAP